LIPDGISAAAPNAPKPFSKFTDVAQSSGLTRTMFYGNPGKVTYIVEEMGGGCAFFDYDNDGWMDIFIVGGRTLVGIPPGASNRLYKNNRDGTFTDVTEKAGLLDAGWGVGVCIGDFNNDGFEDLFVTYYGQNKLYRNNGDGTFTDVTRSAGIDRAAPTFGLTAMAADYFGSGWPDIYVASDSTPSLLFRNQRDGSFLEQGLQLGVAVNEDGTEQSGMGLGLGDFDTDGELDLLKTHFSGDRAVLYRNIGRGGFEDVTLRAGLGVETRYVGWGAGIQDLDNDGLPDLFWATGAVYPEVEKVHPDYPYKTPRVLFRNLGNGRFEELVSEAGPAIAEGHCSRGVAFGDFDNDGDMDILIMNVNEPPSLLRNDVSGGGHWLKVRLVGTKSNRSAIGATVIATYGGRRQAQAVTAQSGYLSANDRRLHFGLGAVRSADLEIRWPSGLRESVKAISADRLIIVREGEGVVKVESFTGARTGRS
jgi:hypothetical protein